MRILYVVQRYGERIVGGSETACRLFAERLLQRGHHVEVLTSCAHNYSDWADEYESGTSYLNGVAVHRLPVSELRLDESFSPLHARMMANPRSLPLFEQQRWARLMGPKLKGFEQWLLGNATKFDVVVFMTYLYTTTTSGLPTVSGLVPTILQPTAHDEPPAYVGIYHSLFRQPDAFLFFTPEEREVVHEIYQLDPPGPVIGIGMDIAPKQSEPDLFRRQFSEVSGDYVIYVGRLDSNKGVGELVRFFGAYVKRNSSNLQLVLAGNGQLEVPVSPSIVLTGFLDEEMKKSAIAGAKLVILPSYFESFSIVLCEGWLQQRPALVQGRCEVLRGQAMRSNGAIPYQGYAQFEEALELLTRNQELNRAMGEAGYQYVKKNYDWNEVMSQFESAVLLARDNFARRRL